MASESVERREGAPVIEPGYTYESVTDSISSIVLRQKTPRGWWIGFAISLLLTLVLFVSLGYLLLNGAGVWGLNIPVGWAFDITNFVWWVGIGHAGTLISAILLLFRQQWRTSINRFAEAMTLFAVANAGLVPAAAHRPALAGLLADPVPEQPGAVAELSQPAGVGCVRDHHLCHHLAAVLVCRPDPRPGDAARQREKPLRAVRLWLFLDGLARVGQALAALRARLPAAGRAGDAAGRLGA